MILTALETIFSGKTTLNERFAACQQAGFDGIDLRDHADDAGAIQRLKGRYGLEVGMIYSALPIPLLARTALQRAAAVEIVREKAAFARAVGARGVIVVPVFGPPRIDPRTVFDITTVEKVVLACLLSELEPTLVSSGVYLAIEPLNHEETHLFTSPGLVAGWLKEKPWQGVMTMADTYHMDREDQDLAYEVKTAADLLGCIHLSCPQRALPSSEAVDFVGFCFGS